jgi:uncharacterized protein (DUF2236 family)
MNARLQAAGLGSPLRLPGSVQHGLDAFLKKLLRPPGAPGFDFGEPSGAEALTSADSVCWRIFKNPLSVFIGGVGAVILELADPAVRSGVWEHTSFRTDPLRRLQRTGLAAMITIYGPKDKAQAMVAGVRRMHERVTGTTPSGEAYRANDPALLTWVHSTAVFGFAMAYSRYVRPLTPAEFDSVFRESLTAARLYGAENPPASYADVEALFAARRPRLEPSPVIFEFLEIMNRAPITPAPLRPFQRMLVRAAVELTPPWLRERLGLAESFGLRAWEKPLIRQAGALADRILLHSSPAVQSCLRLGLPADYLYRRQL